MDGGEFGKLALPIWEDTKGLDIAILVKVTVVASNKLIRAVEVDQLACLVPKCRIVARVIVSIAKFEVEILPRRLVFKLVFVDGKRRTFVEVTFETEKITKPESQ